MQIIILQLVGVFLFFLLTLILGIILRMRRTQKVAESLSRVEHGLLYLCLFIPQAFGFFYPGLEHYDSLMHLRSLPYALPTQILGGVLLAVGLLLWIISFRAIIGLGKGFAAFKLTRSLISTDLYGKIRNPMSLGYYLVLLSAALISGSLGFLIVVVLLVIPVHVFYLRFFEENELVCRYGEPYLAYRDQVPFMLPS